MRRTAYRHSPAAVVRDRRATAVPWPTLFFLVAALCLKCSAAQPRAREQYKLFDKAVRKTMYEAIQKIDAPLRPYKGEAEDLPLLWTANLQASAKAIVEALKGAKDEQTNRLGKDFGVAYTSVLWNADIPRRYMDTFTEGTWDQLRQYEQRQIARGAVTRQRCDREDPCPPELGEIGSMGCPCPTGASFMRTALTKRGYPANCMVYYYPIQHPQHIDPLYLSRVFEYQVINCALQNQPGNSQSGSMYPISLSQVAANIIWGNSIYNNPTPAQLFKAVAVIQASGPYQWHDPAEDKRSHRNTHFGVFSEFGHILVEHAQVPMPLGDSRPPAALFLIAAIPFA